VKNAVVKVVGTDATGLEVFNKLVGPFTDERELLCWLGANGFSVQQTSKRKGGGYLHKTGISRSPLATEVWASTEILCEPERTLVNHSFRTT